MSIDSYNLKPNHTYRFGVDYNILLGKDDRKPHYYEATYISQAGKGDTIWVFKNFTDTETKETRKEQRIEYLGFLHPSFGLVDTGVKRMKKTAKPISNTFRTPVTRSQTQARREREAQGYLVSTKTQNATQLVPEKSTFEFVSSTNKYKDIIQCLHYGRATTKEQVCFRQSSITFQILFDYTFAYEYSNGLYDSIFIGFKFIKSDNTPISDREKEILTNLVKQHYK